MFVSLYPALRNWSVLISKYALTLANTQIKNQLIKYRKHSKIKPTNRYIAKINQHKNIQQTLDFKRAARNIKQNNHMPKIYRYSTNIEDALVQIVRPFRTRYVTVSAFFQNKQLD